jgi:glycolate oxidase FAD binding subunit
VGLSDLDRFAAEVGDEGPVTVVGGRTAWQVGGPVDPAAREVRAPCGVVAFEPADLTVRVGAGTPVAEVDAALAAAGQAVALPDGPGATVGGVLAVGRSGVRRLGWGPVRDALLEARYVSAEGRLVKAGGPTVKNVSGFDLCRLLVGSLGTLGLIGEVVLRTRPLPAASRWLAGPADPFPLLHALHRPSSLLWDGTTTWALLEGDPADVDEQAAVCERAGMADADGPPPLPAHRWSLPPGELRGLTGRFVAEVGVGVVHADGPPPPRDLDPVTVDLNERVRSRFDPTRRLNPGRDPLSVS